MKFLNCKIEHLPEVLAGKKGICFGLSKHIRTLSQKMGGFPWLGDICCFIDNNEELHGKTVSCEGRTWKVYSPDYIKNMENAVVIITSGIRENVLAMAEQLQDMNLPDSVKCYSLLMMETNIPYDNTELDLYLPGKNYGIEKIIHCCWFSGEKKPAEYQKCIDSWKKYCPDYEIKEWNSVNYDVSKNKYMKQAYERRLWAYVSDYARLDVVNQHGGIYLDMDVELLKNLDDLLGYKEFFSFYEGGYVDLGSGFGAVKNAALIKRLLDEYEGIDFAVGNEKINTKDIMPQPMRLLPVFKAYGYKTNMRSQLINDSAFLSPSYFKVIDDTQHEYRELCGSEYAIHWHHAGWFDEQTLLERDERIKREKRLYSIFNP